MQYQISTLTTDGKISFKNPRGLAVSPQGDLYVADTRNNRIVKISNLNSSSQSFTVIAGCCDYLLVSATTTIEICEQEEGNLAVNAKLFEPHSVAFRDGIVYFTDTRNKRVCKIVGDRLFTIAGHGIGGISFEHPFGIAVSKDGDIFVSDSHIGNLTKISKNGQVEINYGKVFGVFRGIDITEKGYLYVVDSKYNTISKISPDGNICRIGLAGDGGNACSIPCNNPFGVSVAPNGEVLIADTFNHQIRKVSHDGFVQTIAGSGFERPPLFSSIPTKFELRRPYCVAFSPSGDMVYIADNYMDRICILTELPKKVPHINYFKKLNRDTIVDGLLTCPMFVLEQLDIGFHNRLMEFIKVLTPVHVEIAQHTIDKLIYEIKRESVVTLYDPKSWVNLYDPIDILFTVGSSTNLNMLKSDQVRRIRKANNQSQYLADLDKLTHLLELHPNLCCPFLEELCMFLIKEVESFGVPKNFCDTIFYNINADFPSLAEETSNISLSESLQTLFNNEKTSDLTISIDDEVFYCHKTILSSRSDYWEILLNNPQFNDVEDGKTYKTDTSEFPGHIHKMVLQYCYDKLSTSVIQNLDSTDKIFLLNAASFYGVQDLLVICWNCLEICVDNYFELCSIPSIVQDDKNFYSKLVKFGAENMEKLFCTRSNLKLLPEDLKDDIIFYHLNGPTLAL